MNAGTLVHPRLLEKLAPSFYTSECTMQEKGTAQDAYNAPVETWTDIAGAVALVCAVAPYFTDQPSGVNERRLQHFNYDTEMFMVSFASAQPALVEAIRTKDLRAVVDGTPYHVLGVESASDGGQTRLRVELVKV